MTGFGEVIKSDRKDPLNNIKKGEGTCQLRLMKRKKIFRLDTEKSTYVMGVSPEGFLGHIYYGDRLFMEADNYLLRMEEPPYTPSVNKREKSAFLDFFPMEYPTGGIGDTGKAA